MNEIGTLGGKASFWYERIGNQLWIEFGPNRTRAFVNENIIAMTRTRHEVLEISFKSQASQYTDPKWDACPSRVLCPYVAKLIADNLI